MKVQSSTRYRALFLACVVSGAFFLMTGCVTDIKPGTSQNPAPAENFSAFNRFEVNTAEKRELRSRRLPGCARKDTRKYR